MLIWLRKSQEFNQEDFRDTLIHELIHTLLVDNKLEMVSYQKWKYSLYKNESRITLVHIDVNAILKAIYLEFLGEDRLQKDIRFCEKYLPEYKRAWDIVEEMGHVELVKKFRS